MKSELVQSLLENESEENDLVYFDLTLGGGGLLRVIKSVFRSKLLP